MAVPGRISAGRGGPAESAWPPETEVRTECLLGSPKHPSRSATGRVVSPHRAVWRKETKRKLLSWGYKFVSVRSVKVDDRLAGEEFR
jgi:hypothetical protein